MSAPSPDRKYYIVPTKPEEGGRIPDTDVPAWTARYLSDDAVLIRDPDGRRSYPVLGVDVAVIDAIQSLPVELSLSMTQEDANAACDYHGLNRINLSELGSDRVGGR